MGIGKPLFPSVIQEKNLKILKIVKAIKRQEIKFLCAFTRI